MNWYLRRLIWFFNAGGALWLATHSVQQAMLACPPLKVKPLTDADLAEMAMKNAEWANDMVRNLDQAAGATHDYVGNDPVQCSLCLTPAAHPIHTWPAEIVDPDGS